METKTNGHTVDGNGFTRNISNGKNKDFQQKITEDIIDEENLPDRMAETFSGRKIFLTGGTGFVGKCILERLLRRCADIGHIYLLARPKKGKTPKQRFDEIANGPLFEKVRNLYTMSDLYTKVTVIEGDIATRGYNLSAQHLEIITKADIIIHGAASIRFDDTLKESIMLNTRGTKYLLEIAKQFSKLELLVYISTAYCHPEQPVLEEKSYPARFDPHQIINSLEWLDDEMVETLKPHILGDIPNSYTLSKSLAEALIEEVSDEIPVLILRPSVVIPILQDPVPGWTDNLNGPGGLLLAAGKGVLRTMYCDDRNYVDLMPVDIFVNVVFVSIWNYLKNGDHSRFVHSTSSEEVRISWGEVLDIGREIVTGDMPLNNIAWYPGGEMTRSRTLHNIRAIFRHWIPAILVDTLLICLGIKPVLIRVHQRISKGFTVLEYYVENQWTFKSTKMRTVRHSLNKREKKLYKLYSDDLDYKKYLESCILAIRRYMLKQSDDMLPAARRNIKIMKYLDIIVTTLFYAFLLYYIGGWFYNKLV